MDAIFARRSIRKYIQQPVPDELVEELLKAAMSAPSAHNEQPWHFVVIKDRNTLNQIASFHPYAKMLTEAPLAILVCGDVQLEKSKGRMPLDCAAATENILIMAQAKGLGAVWVAAYPDKNLENQFRNLLGIPANVRPVALIPMGYPGEQKEPANRYDPARVHRNRW